MARGHKVDKDNRDNWMDAARSMCIWGASLSITGIAAVFVADGQFPLLDSNSMFGWTLLLFLLSLSAVPIGCLLPRFLFWFKLLMTILIAGNFVVAMMIFLNGVCDFRPPTVRSAVVENKRISETTKGWKRYEITVDSWRPGRSEEIFYIPEALFHKLANGDQITLTVHDGRFGWPWHGPLDRVR